MPNTSFRTCGNAGNVTDALTTALPPTAGLLRGGGRGKRRKGSRREREGMEGDGGVE